VRALRLALWAGVALVALASFGSYVAGDTPYGELASHFRVQWAAASLLLVAVASYRRGWTSASVALPLLLLNLAPLVRYAMPPPASAVDGVPLRVLVLNFHSHRADDDAVRALVEREQPDLLVLTELAARHDRLIAEFARTRPHVLRDPERDAGGFETVIVTSWKPEGYSADRSVEPFLPVSRVRLCREEACMNLVALHASRPLGREGPERRAAQFAIAARLSAEAADGRTILAGDLNCSPWSPAFARLLREGRLADSAPGRGFATTWLSRIPLFGLAIDHILIGNGIVVRERRVGPDVGSDHLPVIADLALVR
jgi:endonuclease/exonuclease/phosphatase (EEP) superfamily protein YafD